MYNSCYCKLDFVIMFFKKKSNKPIKILFQLKISIPHSILPNFDFVARFNYLTNGNPITINTNRLQDLMKQGLITSKQQRVRELKFEPTLQHNGFEVKNIPEGLYSLLMQYRENVVSRKRLREEIRQYLETLVSKHFNLPAVAFDTVYRNTNNASSEFKSIPLTHIDFPEQETENTLSKFALQWQPRVEKKLGDGQYNSRNLEFMLNIWMPLDSVTASPLALCDLGNKIDKSRMHNYNAVRRDGSLFKAVSFTPPKDNDPWFYLPAMKQRCYLFYSSQTPHSATEFPGETDNRESLEVRLGVFRKTA